MFLRGVLCFLAKAIEPRFHPGATLCTSLVRPAIQKLRIKLRRAAEERALSLVNVVEREVAPLQVMYSIVSAMKKAADSKQLARQACTRASSAINMIRSVVEMVLVLGAP